MKTVLDAVNEFKGAWPYWSGCLYQSKGSLRPLSFFGSDADYPQGECVIMICLVSPTCMPLVSVRKLAALPA